LGSVLPNHYTIEEKINALQCCVIIPTYNNEQTLADVIRDVAKYTPNIIIVNDGSTDSTPELLKAFPQYDVVSHMPNRGKGMALRQGMKHAAIKGYVYAITIDSDGQHFADDIPVFIDAIEKEPGALLVGARNLTQENMPRKNTFGNKFSNFWFRLETGINLPDTQSGYRLYPLNKLKGVRYFSAKYEFEIEVMVKAAWKGVKVMPVNIRVFYAEKGKRVSHFRPFKDFARISILNTYLVMLALLWYKPIHLVRHLRMKHIKAFLVKHFLDREESIIRKSLSVAFGVFMGIVPIWGYQFVSALILAHFMKLNKAIVGLAANISVPPMIPFLLYGSLKTGQIILQKESGFNLFKSEITFETIKHEIYTYIVGSFCFAIIMGIIFGLLTYITLTFLGKRSLAKANS
jgi:glycosyltransferase involved in cell wall biosynthesis